MGSNTMKEPTYKIENTRVYGNGQSYTVHNKTTAETLAYTLNTLTDKSKTYNNIENKLDDLTKQVIQLKLTINILESEIQHFKEVIEK